ncbi:MAG: hypothetical protein FD180_2518, partial [Planctomycetota bacterium]
EPEPESQPTRRGRTAGARGRSTPVQQSAPGRSRAGGAPGGGRSGSAFATAPKKNNTMLFAAIGGGALVLIIAVAGFVMAGKNGKDGTGGKDAETAKKDDAFEKMRKYADDSPSAAFEFAEACEKKNDRETAVQYYLRAVKLDPKYSKAQDKLRWVYTNVKKQEAGSDPAKLDALLDWLKKATLEDEALVLAEAMVKTYAPNSEKAHMLVGDVKVDGKWWTKGEAELAQLTSSKKVENAEYDRLSPREKKVYSLKTDYKTYGNKGEEDREYLDCAPDSPHVLCMEKSTSYNAKLMLEAFKECVVTLYKLFFDKYSALFDVKSFGTNEVCFIYVFESSARYHEISNPTPWAGGHFEPGTGRIYIYKDTSQLYETLFHEGIHQLVHTVSQMKVEKVSERRSVNMFWFTEGIATFFESFKRDDKGGFILGEVSSNYKPYMKKMIADGKHKKLKDLFNINYMQFAMESRNPSKRSYVNDMYAQSWSVVYFLYTHENGKYKDAFNKYFKIEVDKGGSFDGAKEIFGDLDKLNTEYENFYKAMK